MYGAGWGSRFARAGHSGPRPEMALTGHQAAPSLAAWAAAAARDGKSSLVRMLATWRLTVCSLRNRRSAISWLLRPWATRPRTSVSRGLRPGTLAGGATAAG